MGKLKTTMSTAGLDAPEIVKFGIGEADKGKYFLRTQTVSLLTDVERSKVKSSVVGTIGEPASWNDKSEMGNVILVKYAASQDKQKIKDAAVAAGLFTADEINVEPAQMGSDTDFRIYLPGVKSKVEKILKTNYEANFC